MNLTREQAITEHRKMWNWITDKIEERKEVFGIEMLKDSYLMLNKYTETLAGNCFLCEYALRKSETKISVRICECCPVEIPNEKILGSGCLGGLFRNVCWAKNWKKQAELARQIANLPERMDI